MMTMLRLAWPVILGHIGLMTMALVDLLAVGRVSPAAVGAVGIGSSLFGWFMIFGIGLLSAMDYLVSLAIGAGDEPDTRRTLDQALWLGLIVGIPLSLAIWVLAGFMAGWGLNPEIVPLARSFLRILSWSLVPVFLFVALRLYLQAKGIVRPAMWILFGANLFNIAANYALVFGNWGFPRLGSDGTAWATLSARIVMLAAIGIVVARELGQREGRSWALPRMSYEAARMRMFLKVGMPAALQMTFEVGVFALSTTLAGKFASEAVAAHQIVLNIASLTFMVPLGLGAACAVLVGQAVGAGRYDVARATGWHGLIAATVFMSFSALVLIGLPEPILGLYTSDSRVLETAVSIIVFAGLFQLSDGAQAVLTSALRGLGDTRGPALANLVGHWVVGLPLGLVLGFGWGWGLPGIWIGLSVGLTVVALALIIRFKKRSDFLQRGGAALFSPMESIGDRVP